VKLFAEAIGAKMQLVPVRPDWSDSSDLFGHNDLSGKFHPGAIIDFIKQAEWDKSTPHFLCLDEMNLARVEYYLSDFLSIIETRDRNENGVIETDALVDASYFQAKEAREKYGRVYLPENLYIIGTVNMDETTFPFSKKVLDRANTIEFSFVNLMAKATAGGKAVAQKLDNNFLKTEYLYLRDCDDEELIDNICFDLEELNQILVKANLHVGYRVRDEISFYMMNNKKADLLTQEAAFDHEIMQKILPRVQGSSAAIKDVLSELFIKCAGDYTGFAGAAAYEQMNAYLDSKSCKYPNSTKKIAFMMRRYEEDGFTSYWL
jgi:5-methylcytosine-specific restriction endonuclease McrBC GTP-binding regulatory subunit McrB